MKYLKKFNESADEDEMIELLEDYLLEYFDKWKIIEEDKYSKLEFDYKKDYNGTYRVEHVSTKYFKTSGFPDDKSGYRVKITTTKPIDEYEFKKDMESFINRVRKSGYNYDTFIDEYSTTVKGYYIAFFK